MIYPNIFKEFNLADVNTDCSNVIVIPDCRRPDIAWQVKTLKKSQKGLQAGILLKGKKTVFLCQLFDNNGTSKHENGKLVLLKD